MHILRPLHDVLTDPTYRWLVIALVVLGDAMLTELIIHFIPYTEIDWETYMFHIDLYLNGERNYASISGPTGPLVYPAGHVYIHQFLHRMTSSGLDVRRAQHIYGALYVISLTLSCTIYGRAGGVPNYVVLLLPLSRRLHSIYVLRLFNDCWVTVATQAAVLAYADGWDYVGTLLFSLALSIKMSALLYFPGIVLLLWKRRGLLFTATQTGMIVITQALLALPFATAYPNQYIAGAFDLSRIFMYKWTVNWRFVDENTFLSPTWANGLFLGHLCTLCAFALMRWCRSDGGLFALLKRGIRQPMKSASVHPVTCDHVVTILLTTNLIGIVFARSLHYQFYAWYAQQIPFLAWRTRFHVLIRLLIIITIEYSWNVFPSTTFSSTLLIVANSLLLAGVWHGYPEGKADAKALDKAQ